ncbi:riboflavin kinase-like isoform X2 [Acanthaster planci]|uniref:Riboflavin kinase n=1 Tax=Acanthaster planci TaxID=133434 RepID=A0A8B7XWY7_ACAPL|nr:riboflavin kinase-like isoform X2 [Acanthaster planci]
MLPLPLYLQGRVVKGFRRGSKEVGFPTANYPDDVVKHLPSELTTGVYCGWASVDHGDVHKMVLSLGWNPYYQNTKKSMETHIMHQFKDDFYGSNLSIVILAFIRPEKSFTSLDELIRAIKTDIAEADMLLDRPENKIFQQDNFFNVDSRL